MSRVVSLPTKVSGQAFADIAIARALHNKMALEVNPELDRIVQMRFGADTAPMRIAEMGNSESVKTLKAQVSAGASIDGNWAEDLAAYDQAAAEFFGLVRDKLIISKLSGIRRVPLRTRLLGQTGGFNASWVGQGQAIPVSSGAFTALNLPARQVAALTVLSDEVLRSSDPASAATVRADMVGAIAEAINASFLDPTNAGVDEIEPASVTYGAPTVAATGDSVTDLRNLVDAFPGDIDTAVLVGSAQTFVQMHDPLSLPKLGARGGEALGIPAFACKASRSNLALIDGAGIAWGAGDTFVNASSEGSIEMNDAPTGDSVTPAAASLVSLFQTESTAILTDQVVNWKAVRPATAVLTGVAQS